MSQRQHIVCVCNRYGDVNLFIHLCVCFNRGILKYHSNHLYIHNDYHFQIQCIYRTGQGEKIMSDKYINNNISEIYRYIYIIIFFVYTHNNTKFT